jgi:hypothetical protein
MLRSRWLPPGVPTGDEQETDENDAADLGLSENSGMSETSMASLTSGSEADGSKRRKAPPPPGSTSVVEQFRQAGHLQHDPVQISMAMVVLTSVACVAVGILIGFILGYFFPR